MQNIVHCSSLVVRTLRSIARALHAVVRALRFAHAGHALSRNAVQPAPRPVATGDLEKPIATEFPLSRQKILCCDRTPLSWALGEHLLRHRPHARPYRDTLHLVPVVTQSSLSRHRTSHLYRDRKLSVVTEHPRRPIVTGRARHTRACRSFCRAHRHALAPSVTTPLQCVDPRLKMGSSPF